MWGWCGAGGARGAGYIAGFPATYGEKVGKTSDAMYKGFAANVFGLYVSGIAS